MKPVEDVTACVVDYGTFGSIAEKLAETMKRVYYYSPYETEYQDIRDYIRGYGAGLAQKLDEPLDPEILPSIDLFVFPDIGFGGLQRHLKGLGKAVWGHMGATELELDRDLFLDVLEEVGLPTIHSEKIVGLNALAEHLKDNTDKWIKLNRFRGNMDTWHHIDFQHSERTLDSLAVILGGAKDNVVFVVQDNIESDMEGGYDGWCIDGKFPEYCFQGYEKKNELYLAAVEANEDLPDEIKVVNEAMAPVLLSYGYRGWWATEIRIKDGVPYFIDPTPRMPGQSGEHHLETCSNLPDVIWQGANGRMVQPIFRWEFAAEATLHYESNTKDPTIIDEWKTLRIPPQVERWVKLYHYCKLDGLYHFGGRNSDEVGVVIGGGDSCKASIDDLSDHLKMLKDLPLHAETSGFVDLLKSIEEAEKNGIKFGSGEIPKPESIIREIA